MTGPHSWIAVAASVRTLRFGRRNGGLVADERRLRRLHLHEVAEVLRVERARALVGRARGGELGLRGLELRDGLHVVGVERRQAREIEHRSEGADLILIGRRLRHDRLETDRASAPSASIVTTGSPRARQRHAQAAA